MPNFPVSIEEITPAWLTGALGEACGLKGAEVPAIEAEPIGVGTGFLGVVSRLRLTYDCDCPTAPRSVIIKLPSHDPGAG